MKDDPNRIAIGKDTRRSSYIFEYSLVASGADAYMLHVATTLSVAYIARVDNFDCGIMLSGQPQPLLLRQWHKDHQRPEREDGRGDY